MDQEKIKSNDENIKVLRTYTSDMAEAVRENEASVIKIALAEKAKREEEEIYIKAEGTKTSKIFFVLGGVFLIIAAIVGSLFLISKKEKIPEKIVKNTDTFILHDSYSFIDVTNINKPEDLFLKINQNPEDYKEGIRAIFLTKLIKEISQELTTADFLSMFKINAPNALTRSLSDKYLFGQYKRKNSADPKIENFLIFETNNYNQAYASLLDWERTMPKDLSIFFYSDNNAEDNSQKKWQDIIINNKDTRVLYGQNGQAVLYYALINNKVIITTNLEILKELISRIITKNN